MTRADPSGYIFDIQRFSLHDGPGIRTTVFLQGCPLRCLWCHNPEGLRQGRAISYRPDACLFCQSCVPVCERCGKCIEACVFGALTAEGELLTVSHVMSLILRDKIYYNKSGGGMTLSGGEPLFQAQFTLSLLRTAKESGIHTCIETCGEASRETFARILPLVDLFLYDFKVSVPESHKTLTGVDNHRILANLDFLYRQGAAIRLRCPLIPGLNDAPDDLQAIAALAGGYPRLLGVEIMPYHNLGHQKYRRFGIPDPLPGLPAMTQETKEQWMASLGRFGCSNAYID